MSEITGRLAHRSVSQGSESGSGPMQEYRATWYLRLGVLLLLSPIYVVGAVSMLQRGAISAAELSTVAIPLAIVALVWSYYGTLRVQIDDTSISKRTMVDATVVPLDSNMQVFQSVRTPLGSLGKVMVDASVRRIIDQLGPDGAAHVKVRVVNRGNGVSLDNNLRHIKAIRSRLDTVLREKVLPGVDAQYAAGNPVEFGPISIQGGELRVGRNWGSGRVMPGWGALFPNRFASRTPVQGFSRSGAAKRRAPTGGAA